MYRLRYRLALLLAFVLIAGACSQSASDEPAGEVETTDDGDSSEPDTDGQSEPPETDEPAADDSVETPVAKGPAPVGEDTPGVTDDTVTVSFVITDTSAVAAAFGWELPDEGDREAQIMALVETANANGGVSGRMIEPKIHIFNAIQDSPVSEESLCNAITQDDKAFAVVMTGQFQENARPCYANAQTLMLDLTLYPLDQSGFEELAPYYWSPVLPSYEDVIAGLAGDLTESGWFEGATVGVIAIESAINQRAYEQQLLPVLDDAGVDVVSYNTIDPTDGTSFNNDQLQAIVNFKEAGVDKVIAVGGSRLVSWFIDTSITQNFTPAYAMTSYDSPEFSVFNYAEYLSGASGISVLPGFDVNDGQYAFPAGEAEQGCLDSFTAAGLDFETRANVRTGLMFCDAIRLMTTAGADLDEFSAQGMTEAFWRLGDTFEAASVYGVEYEEGKYAGGDLFRRFSFDESCGCMAIGSDPIDFDG